MKVRDETFDDAQMAEVRRTLRPCEDTEFNLAAAKVCFGKNADLMLRYAPFSFMLTKLMWCRGEEPWAK